MTEQNLDDEARRVAREPEELTSRVPRLELEHTPAPLPPSPLAEEQEAWFESVPTNPAATADLAALSMAGDSVITGMTPIGRRSDHEQTRSMHRPTAQVPAIDDQPTWVLPALLAATSLAVGMVLGALIFGGDPSPAPARAGFDCATCPAPAGADGSGAAAVVPGGAGDTVEAEPPPRANHPPATVPASDCAFEVRSVPGGAAVSVDGAPAGTTPVTVQPTQCGRKLLVEVRKARWQLARRNVTPKAGAAGPLDIQLARPRARLSIATSPPGASIAVRGKVVGKSPLTVTVPAWVRIPVTATRRGYRPARGSAFSKGGPVGVNLRLKRR